jgi:uncharacterized protein
MRPTFAASIAALAGNRTLWVPLATWAAVQVWKFLAELIFRHRLDPSRLFTAGGMPSSHSALVAALAISAGMNAGFGSASFAIATVLAMIVMYDAAGIRQAAGKQAEKINSIVEELLSGHPLNDEHLREILGHTPFQVFVGGMIGVIAGWVFNQ